MKKLVAMFLITLIIGATPAYAVQYGEITADMTVRGKGVESQINETFNMTVEQNSSVETNTVTELNTAGNNNSVASTNNQTTVRENIGTQNSTKNTSGIVMQTRAYTCGPAALATVLQNMGFNVTEQELKVLAGTDTSGTTMYGLARAAQSKGLSAAGMELSVDDLRSNHIVHVVIDGTAHFSVVREITETSVKLADPSLGNIVMSREKFNEIFTSHALVISNPNVQLNQTANNTSKNLTVNVQLNQAAATSTVVNPNQTAATSNSTVNVQEVNQTAVTNESENSTVNVQELNQTAVTSESNSTVNVQLNQTATSENKNLIVIPNVQEANQTAVTNESNNLTVSNPNVRLNQTAATSNLTVNVQLNQIAATNTSENLSVSNLNVQELNQTVANNTYTGHTITNVQEVNQTAEQANSSAQNLTSEEQAISTDTSSVQAMTADEMLEVRGKGWPAVRQGARILLAMGTGISSAKSGAKIGSIFGPKGTIVGAVVGFGVGSGAVWITT